MKVLLVGLGGMGRVHYCAIEKISGVEVTAAVGTGEKDAAVAAEWNIPMYPSITEAYKDGIDIDVVDITTPSFLHKEHVLEALEYARNVICEKPAALSLADVNTMYDKAEEKGAKLVIAHVLRFTKEYSFIRDIVRDGRYGKVLDASFTRLSAVPEWAQGGWLFDKSKSGLLPYDLHIHDLDVIISTFGKMDDFTFNLRKGEGVSYPEYLSAEYKYDGYSVKGEAGWLRSSIPFTATYRVIFEKGTVVYDGSRITEYPYHKDPITTEIKYDVVISTGINVPPTGWYYEELLKIFSYFKGDISDNPVPKDDIVILFKTLDTIMRGID